MLWARVTGSLLFVLAFGCGPSRPSTEPSPSPTGTPDSGPVAAEDAGEAVAGDPVAVDSAPAPEKDATDTGLTWWQTCGDPACGEWRAKKNVPLCTDERIGAPCSQANATCDPKHSCNQLFRCTDHDPATECPVSRRALKEEIRYLSSADREALLGELLRIQLASYRYRGQGGDAPRRLGFLIDDNPEQPAVAPGGQRVDLYAYLSMAVAALQVQQEQIERLERRVRDLERRPQGD